VPYTIEETILVAAPPEAVWKYLENPWSWPQWWPACREARTGDRKPLREGGRLRLVLKPSLLTFTFEPLVNVVQPGRALIWTGTGAGVTGRHAFFLEARPNGTLVRQREDFSGPGLALFLLLAQVPVTRRMFQRNLRGLKRFAERGA
jgi:uncharacterized protein YndB with AHSA1/START domain